MDTMGLIAANETAFNITTLPGPSEEHAMPAERKELCRKIEQVLSLNGHGGLLDYELSDSYMQSTKPHDLAMFPDIPLAENGSNAATHHRRDEMRINFTIQNTERAESHVNALRTLSNKFGVAMEMAWKINAENDFEALKKLHPVPGYTKLLDGIAIFNAWKTGGNTRLDNVRANSKADDLLKVLEKTSPADNVTGQEFAAYAKVFETIVTLTFLALLLRPLQ